MRRVIRRLFPSMFHRRLLMLTFGAVMVSLVLVAQTASLTLGQRGRQAVQRAESLLESSRLIPTARGRILDRRGRVLAYDRQSFDLAVQYDVLTGQWAATAAWQHAKAAHKQRWGELGPSERYALADLYQPRYDQMIERLWQQLCELTGRQRDELEKRKTAIVQRVQRMQRNRQLYLYNRLSRLDDDATFAEVADERVAEQVQAHVVIENLDDEVRFEIEQRINQEQQRVQRRRQTRRYVQRFDDALYVWQQLAIEPATKRQYPLETMTVLLDMSTFPSLMAVPDSQMQVTVEGVGLHTVGQMLDKVLAEHINKQPFDATGDLRGYRPGDSIGRLGIEKSMEQRLRGARGVEVRYHDGRATRRTEPVVGDDVQLTIDIALQLRIEALMQPHVGLMQRHQWQGDASKGREGEPLNGAAVVLDVASGQVLAAASLPTLSMRAMRDEPDSVWRDAPNVPWLHRAVGRPYQAGSTVKPLVLAAAITGGDYDPATAIECTGYYNPNDPLHLRCWIYKQTKGLLTHKYLRGPQAIQYSCNIFFFKLGDTIGSQRLVQWYERFGLGDKPRCGLNEEVAGYTRYVGSKSHVMPDAVQMGIGQGPVSWTPIQAAAAFAVLANDGVYRQPTFIRGAQQQTRDLNLSRIALDQTLQGMYLSANGRHGTTHQLPGYEPIFNIDNVTVRAKSGTADPGYSWVDLNNDGKRDKGETQKYGDHAWCIALVQRPQSSRPDYVVVVVAEHGGSGGRVAGPVVNQILHAMRAEGYL